MSLQKKLKEWFKENGRDFPWREDIVPYRLMIAEFMLQRTKAEQVIPVFAEFIRRYPELSSLSRANEHEIMQILSPLGLRWRSSHFISAAQFITKECDSAFPDNASDLMKIPGIGEYIAGAILVVCFRIPYPVIDSNIGRFINRFFGLNLKGEVRRKRIVIEKAEELFTCQEPGILLFSILDFTSIVCRSRTPKCILCGLRDTCKYER